MNSTLSDSELDEFEAKQHAVEQRRIERSMQQDARHRKERAQKSNEKRSLSALLADQTFSMCALRENRQGIARIAISEGESFDMIYGYRVRELLWLIEMLLEERTGSGT